MTAGFKTYQKACWALSNATLTSDGVNRLVKEARKRVVEAAEAIGEIVEVTGSLLTKNLENQILK